MGDSKERRGRPISYQIPAEEFQIDGVNVPTIDDYEFPDKVTRPKFVPFLEDIFARSRGDGAALWAQPEWLRVHTGFEYAETFMNFLENGGTGTLSEEERTHFNDAFNKVPKHEPLTRDFVMPELSAAIALESNLIRLAGQADDSGPFLADAGTVFTAADIKGYTTRGELFTGIREYFKTKKDD